MQFYQVKLSAVAFVLAEAILGKTGAEVAHNRVARDLRDHARGRDGKAVAIAVDNRGLRQGEGEHWEPVDEDVVGLQGEAGESEAHRLMGSAQDVDRVDLDRIHDADRPANRLVGEELFVNLLPLFREELFGIVQLPVPEFLRKNDRRRYDRSREGPASRLIDPGDAGNAERPKFAFMPKTAATVHAAIP